MIEIKAHQIYGFLDYILNNSLNLFRSPVAMGYTRGHFCALIPPEPDPVGVGAGALPPPSSPQAAASNYLPLVNSDREVLPLHFTSR